MILHEVELFSTGTGKDKNIFQNILGLKLHINQDECKII
jgi:hypothetical protein